MTPGPRPGVRAKGSDANAAAKHAWSWGLTRRTASVNSRARASLVVQVRALLQRLPGGTSGVAGRNDRGSLRHENDRTLRSARPVHHSLRHDEAFEWPQLHGTLFEIDDEVS